MCENRLRNPSFEGDAPEAPGWNLGRVSNAKVRIVPQEAVEGHNILVAKDRNEGFNPSISQDVRKLRDGTYDHSFSIYVQSDTPRHIRMVIWGWVNNPGDNDFWTIDVDSGHTLEVGAEWVRHAVSCRSGGSAKRVEVYWKGQLDEAIYFDAAELHSIRQ